MKIDSSMIGMESARSYASVTRKSISASLTGGIAGQGSEMSDGSFAGLLHTKEEGENMVQMGSRRMQVRSLVNAREVSSVQERKTLESIREQCVLFLIKWLYSGMRGSPMDQMQESVSPPFADEWQTKQQSMQQNPAQGFGQSIGSGSYWNASYYHGEMETTSFSTQGIVRTADGREINFNLDLTMSRSFQEYYEENISDQLPPMTDPLVINLDTQMATLSDQRFEFDIDADGIKNSIPYLQSGSGYLALDKNGDGIIGDGSELFGTSSGDGFRDLAQYDRDGNGWIDENDDVFEKLLIWSKDETGKDVLYTLKEAGVGAICLQKAATDFSLNSLKDNQANGKIRSTGIFLYENGNVGTMQQLDLAQ